MPHSSQTITAHNADMIDGKHGEDLAPVVHEHDEYALVDHTHDEYALVDHEHTEYVPHFFSDVLEWTINTIGTQTITCGFRPRKIKITAGIEGSASVAVDSNGLSFGSYDGVKQMTLFTYGDLPQYGWFNAGNRLVYLYYPGGGANYNIASLGTITDTGFDLVWGKNGTVPGIKIQMLVEAQG